MAIECVIFDFDGTLVDSESIWNQALAEKLADFGIVVETEELMRKNHGVQFTQVIKNISEEYELELSEEFEISYRSIVSKLFIRDLKPIAGVELALQAIPIPKCIASNGPMDKVRLGLELTGLTSYFDGFLFSGYDIGSWKPDPQLFLHAAKTMGVEPDNCVVIEDSLAGVNAAIAAGMRPLFFNSSDVSDYPSEAHSFSDMEQLPSLIIDRMFR